MNIESWFPDGGGLIYHEQQKQTAAKAEKIVNEYVVLYFDLSLKDIFI